MASKLFDLVDTDSDAFKRDLTCLVKFPSDDARKLIEHLPNMLESRGDELDLDEVSQELEDIGVDADYSDVRATLRMLAFLSANIEVSRGTADFIDNWQSEVANLGLFNSDEIDRFRSIVVALEAVSLQIERSKRIGAAKVGIGSSFEEIYSTVELRSVFSDEDDQQIERLIPMATIRIDLDSGEPATVTFQALPENVQSLIDELESVQRRLEALRMLSERFAENAMK